MVLIVYIEPGGNHREIDVKEGWSAMEGAARSGVEGILAECGGKCNCGTCHVYVEEGRFTALPPPSDEEISMLDSVTVERRPNSRLSCQLKVREDMAGIVLKVADRQY